MKGIILDLEMNQPSNNIIQIGAVLCDFKMGKVLNEFNRFCKLPDGETVDAYIYKLTAISQNLLDEKGLPFAQATLEFWDWVAASNCSYQLAAWGSDIYLLKRQTEAAGVAVSPKLKSLNLKEMSKFFRMAKGGKQRGGLANTMALFNVEFVGRPHDALIDARNTAALVFYWCDILNKYFNIEKVFN